MMSLATLSSGDAMPQGARLIADPAQLATIGAHMGVIVPGLARFAAAEREIAALLPVVDINAALEAAAAMFAPHGVAADLTAGLMASDPFLVLDEMAAALRDAGIRAVTNFPTLQLIDGEAGAGLAAVGLDLAAEMRTLAAFRARGFGVDVYVIDAAAALAAERAGARRLVFHSAFRPDDEADAAFAAVRAAVPTLRVLRHRPAL